MRPWRWRLDSADVTGDVYLHSWVKARLVFYDVEDPVGGGRANGCRRYICAEACGQTCGQTRENCLSLAKSLGSTVWITLGKTCGLQPTEPDFTVSIQGIPSFEYLEYRFGMRVLSEFR